MSRIMISSDLHLGHSNILKFREGFSSVEEHNEIIFDNLASNIHKRDSLILLGDVAFSAYWNQRIKEINCVKKTLILGNHDTDRHLNMNDLLDVYDSIHSLTVKNKSWLSHCPIHPQEFRNKEFNIHGHLHAKIIDDPRYINVCVEQTDFKPVNLQILLKEHREKHYVSS